MKTSVKGSTKTQGKGTRNTPSTESFIIYYCTKEIYKTFGKFLLSGMCIFHGLPPRNDFYDLPWYII